MNKHKGRNISPRHFLPSLFLLLYTIFACATYTAVDKVTPADGVVHPKVVPVDGVASVIVQRQANVPIQPTCMVVNALIQGFFHIIVPSKEGNNAYAAHIDKAEHMLAALDSTTQAFQSNFPMTIKITQPSTAVRELFKDDQPEMGRKL